MKNKLVWSAIILGAIVILVAIFVWPVRENWWQKYQTNKILREYATLDRAYQNDNYGSTTPEGTLELFVEALKKSDADLASNYFVPEKKEFGLTQVKEIISNDRIDEVVRELENYKDKHYLNNNMAFVFSTYYQAEKVWSETKLRLNKYSQKWLIESL